MPEISARLSTALADRYKIERHLGEGGMATVYLAHDLKHDRPVAVKVLRPELAAVLGAERFIQEIKTTANLQHPHILPLFDSGEADSFLYYVMPFIDGETLRDKLNRETQLGIDEAVRITTEVADALDYAHRHNVIHRDIKPENILLHDGRPMVADFGIALAVSAAAGGRMTETGLSLGTPHYMSPEQATAEKDLTNRSDIYSLGCVLYEMLTGEPPHTGASAQAIVMKIVTDEARPVTELRKSVPPHVAAATTKSLEKLAADRFESASAFADALASAGFRHGETAATAAQKDTIPALARITVQHPWLGWAIPAVMGLLVVSAVGNLLPSGPAVPGAGSPMRFPVPVASGVQLPLMEPPGIHLAIAPDGSRVAYAGLSDEGRHLYVRSLEELEARRIPDTEGASQPFFSPDSRTIGYVANNQLYRVSVSGGAPISTASVPSMIGASWGEDGRIVFGALGSGLRIVPAAGGTPQDFTQLEGNEDGHLFPEVLPGGTHVLFTVRTDEPRLEIIALDGSERSTLRAGAVAGRYVSSGHIVYPEAGGLMAAPFDLSRLEFSGAPALALDSVFTKSTIGINVAAYAVSRTGTLVYQPGRLRQALAWHDDTGPPTPWTDPRWSYWYASISPSGETVAATIAVHADDADVWLFGDGPPERFTQDGNNIMPLWTPDGSRVAFGSNRSGSLDLYWKAADMTGEAELLLERPLAQFPGSWSPDGRTLLFSETHPVTGSDIWALPFDADGIPTPVLVTGASEIQPALSPNGRWLAYASDMSGTLEVYVQAYPSGRRRRISEAGGLLPMWSADGRRLYYNEEARIIVRDVSTGVGSEFAVGPAREYLRGPYFTSSGAIARASYALAPDGRFLVPVTEDVTQPPVVVLNWFEELKGKVGN